jgi:hypothetical protein
MFEPLTVSIRRWFVRFLFASIAVLGAVVLVCGQQPAGAGGSSPESSKPDSPKPNQEAVSNGNRGTARYVGYATSRSIFFPDIATNPNPLSAGRKFKLFVDQSISPGYILASALSAAKNQATNSPSAPGQGWDAYGTRYGYSIARASSQAFFGNFVFASILRTDPRFFPESHPSIGRAIKYSVKRLFVTRSDNGNDVFNASAFLGPLAAEALSNAYYPLHEQTGARTAQRYGSDIAWHLGGNFFKEYWPTLFRDMHLKAVRVIPNPGDVSRP